MVLAKQTNKQTKTKQKYIPMKEDRKPRYKATQLWAPYLWQRRQEYRMGKR